MSWCVLASSSTFMEATGEPKRASTPGDTRLPRAQARIWHFITGDVSYSFEIPPVLCWHTLRKSKVPTYILEYWLFGLHDSLYCSPSPCPHAPVSQ